MKRERRDRTYLSLDLVISFLSLPTSLIIPHLTMSLAVSAALMHEASKHEAYFSRLLDRFPQKLVLPATAKEEEESAAAKYYKVSSACLFLPAASLLQFHICVLTTPRSRPNPRSTGSKP